MSRFLVEDKIWGGAGCGWCVHAVAPGEVTLIIPMGAGARFALEDAEKIRDAITQAIEYVRQAPADTIENLRKRQQP